MKQYNLYLPVFKQGSDLASHIEMNNNDPIKSLEGLAAQYNEAATICLNLAKSLLGIKGVEINGDTHCIWLSLPKKIGKKLIQTLPLEEFDYED